jgi:hypothetical protein
VVALIKPSSKMGYFMVTNGRMLQFTTKPAIISAVAGGFEKYFSIFFDIIYEDERINQNRMSKAILNL